MALDQTVMVSPLNCRVIPFCVALFVPVIVPPQIFEREKLAADTDHEMLSL